MGKPIKILALVLMALVFCQCKTDYLTIIHYHYHNESGVDITIKYLNTELYMPIDGETSIKSRRIGNPHPFGSANEVMVVFGEDRYIIYTEDAINPDNPIFNENYTKIKLGDHEYRYEYTFTRKQYESAEPIEPTGSGE